MVALLLFLMCACVGSVVLAAGATASGRVSSAEEGGNKQRYAVSSAADLIMSQLNGTETNQSSRNMTLNQNWTCDYTQSDYDYEQDSSSVAGYQIGTPEITSGTFVLELDQNDVNGKWNTVVLSQVAGSTEASHTYDMNNYLSVDSNHSLSERTKKADNIEVLRDMMAYGIYRHYWTNTTDPNQITDGTDPWQDITMGIIEWDSFGFDEGDKAYKIATESSSPLKMTVSAEDNSKDVSIPNVYVEISMDQDFVLKFDLYCKNDNGLKAAEKWLVYTPVTAQVERASVDNETVENDDNLVITDSNGNTTVSLPNQKHKHRLTRSQNLHITWDDGKLMARDPDKGSDSE